MAPKPDPKCESCGYNLRGLRRHSLCPECGADIVESLRPSPVRDFVDRPLVCALLTELFLFALVGALFLVLDPSSVLIIIPFVGIAGLGTGVFCLASGVFCIHFTSSTKVRVWLEVGALLTVCNALLSAPFFLFAH